jgi:hypothetical protein
MKKLYDLNSRYGGQYKVYVNVAYYGNHNLAIQLITDKGETFSNLTVNLEKLPPNCAYVDTNNLGPEIVDWITKNGLGVPTGAYQVSGFCRYPMFMFDLNKLDAGE